MAVLQTSPLNGAGVARELSDEDIDANDLRTKALLDVQ